MGTSFLAGDEYLLRQQKIKGTQKVDKQSLKELYRQKSNRKIVIFPFYIYLYELGRKNFDEEKLESDRQKLISRYDRKINEAESDKKIEKLTNKKRKKVAKIDRKLEEGNIFMRWGEPVATLDSSAAEATTEQMQLYMKTIGFLDAAVAYQVKVEGKAAKVVYQIEEGDPYIIDSLSIKTTDENIERILTENIRQSLLKRRDRYNQENLSLERERIEALLLNNGYFDFSRQYVNFVIDTSLSEKQLAIETIINNPKNGSHQVYRVDSIVFHLDDGAFANRTRQTTYFNGINYRYSNNKFSEKVLDQRIFINPDSLYSYTATVETQRQLANLDNFKFINIYYDSAGGSFRANIHASPLKKFQTNNELGLGFIVAEEGYPSPFYNFSLKNRNVFNGMENMELSARIGIEGIPSATDANLIYKSIEAGGNFTLTFPQFALPLGARLKRRLGNINPKTMVIAGATFSNRPEYQRNIFNTTLVYTWQKENKKLYNFTLLDLNLINTDTISSEFAEKLRELEQSGNKLINSFKPSFVNSSAFSVTFNLNQYGLYQSRSSMIKFFIENGGAFLYLTGTDFLKRLEHYKYFKTFAEFRHFMPTSKSTGLAFRTFIGFASPYSGTEALPYEKYYFAGGSNGIRAWRPRRLGPGSYTPVKITEEGGVRYDDSFEQPAEILFEANIELRRKIVGFFEGALFVDAGNSWILREEDSRPGANFDANRFYKEIAIGAGAGFRFDFSFLLVRFDLAYKAYDPARPEGSRFIFSKSYNLPPFDNVKNYTFNLGIGYPF